MNPVRWKYLSGTLFAISLLFLGCTIVLPQVKTPQNAVYRGPAVPYGNSTTVVSGYYIPVVEAGSKVTVSIDDFLSGAVDISVFPSLMGAISPEGVPVYLKTPLINSSVTFTANATQPYGVYVISRNSTGFTLVVEATYSSFYWLNTYASIGVIAALATGILYYFYRFSSRRWVVEQKAIREARGEE
jgi:hypothetical protein